MLYYWRYGVKFMPLSKEQLLERQSGLGGSEISSILNLNPFQSAYQLYLKKTQTEDMQEDEDQTEAQLWGNILEPAVASMYELRHNVQLIVPKKVVHPKYPFLFGHADYITAESPNILIEIKTVGLGGLHYWKNSDTDEELTCPKHVQIQCQWYLNLLDLEVAHCVLFGPNIRDYREFEIIKDVDLFNDLVTIAVEFWQRVLDHNSPPIENLNDEDLYLKNTYPENSPNILESNNELDIIALELSQCKSKLKDLETSKRILENQIKDAIGSESGIVGNEWKATWKMTKSNGTNWRALSETLNATKEQIKLFAHKGYRRFTFSYRNGIEDNDSD